MSKFRTLDLDPYVVKRDALFAAAVSVNSKDYGYNERLGPIVTKLAKEYETYLTEGIIDKS